MARQKVGQILITEKLYTTHTHTDTEGKFSAAASTAIAAGYEILVYLVFLVS